jgi:hypothetical protein
MDLSIKGGPEDQVRRLRERAKANCADRELLGSG